MTSLLCQNSIHLSNFVFQETLLQILLLFALSNTSTVKKTNLKQLTSPKSYIACSYFVELMFSSYASLSLLEYKSFENKQRVTCFLVQFMTDYAAKLFFYF